MAVSREKSDRWFRGEDIPGVQFGLNDAVDIIEGPHRGSSGAVISLIEIESVVRFLIELSTGVDVEVEQSLLRLVEKGP